MTAFPALSVANFVLEEAEAQGKTLTIMQLLKLVYIAHGWSLALLDAPLVNEEPEAWQHGPVFPSVYREFRKFGAHPITGYRSNLRFANFAAGLSPEQQSVVQSVVRNYGNMHAFALSRITHEAETPWSLTFKDGIGSSADISNAMIAAHYKKLARERRFAS